MTHEALSEAHMDPHEHGAHAPHVAAKVVVSGDDSVKLQCKLEPEAAADGEVEEAAPKSAFSGLQKENEGVVVHQPITPMARGSVFSASANLADNVDIFSKTLPAPKQAASAAATTTSKEDDSDLAPGFGKHLAKVRSGLKHESGFDSGRDLTPSYRRQDGRSLQQAVDNEQPFSAAWRHQATIARVTEHVSASITTGAGGHVNLAVTTHEAESVCESGVDIASEADDHAAGQTHGVPSSSTAGTADSDAPAKQPSFGKSSIMGDKSAAHAVPASLPSQTSIPIQFSLSKLASGSLSKQPSYLNLPGSGVSSRRSSFSARLERETSQVLVSRQISNAAAGAAAEQLPVFVSRAASLSWSTNPLLSPEFSGRNLAAAAASAEAGSKSSSRQPSFSKPASLSRQVSHGSRQPSAGAAAAAEAALTGPSLSMPTRASRQTSHVAQSSGGNPAAADAGSSRMSSRQPSFSRPASASRQGSQALQPQPSGGNFPLSRSTSRLPSRQPSFKATTATPAVATPQSVPQSASSVHRGGGSLGAELKPASRSSSMSSQVQRSSSLEAMHRQMSISKNAPAVAKAAGTTEAGIVVHPVKAERLSLSAGGQEGTSNRRYNCTYVCVHKAIAACTFLGSLQVYSDCTNNFDP